ncbi:MAG TPA: ATP-binding protein [Opitutaceae bacterium]|nr:ATP-binding protein [Opitutaceae bacterium]
MPHDAAQAIQEKQLLLSRLLARLAHEIRNPLSSLDIHVQLLEEDVAHAAPEVRERSASRFRIIRTELERLDNLVKQFLSLAGRSSTNLRAIDVTRVVEHVCALLRPEATAHGIDVSLETAADLPAVLADPDQLAQALVNLVLNAMQAVERDGRVDVSVAAAGPMVVITVQDSGPGIDEAHAGALFEPFYTTKEDGSGLGLWIVRQIAVAHGGNVRASNATGRGAVFTLTLPAARGDRNE